MNADQRSRVVCQVCLRPLVPLTDGTARNHVRRPGAEDYCGGSGHRLARWPVGQRLRHHAGSVWEVTGDAGGVDDYLLVCVVGTPGWAGGEKQGKRMTVHAEYMHRDGWREIPGAVDERSR